MYLKEPCNILNSHLQKKVGNVYCYQSKHDEILGCPEEMHEMSITELKKKKKKVGDEVIHIEYRLTDDAAHERPKMSIFIQNKQKIIVKYLFKSCSIRLLRL